MDSDQFMQLLMQFGVVPGLLAYLVYWLSNKVVNKLDELIDRVNEMNTKLEVLIKILNGKKD